MMNPLSPQAAICSYLNNERSFEATCEALLDHPEWRVGILDHEARTWIASSATAFAALPPRVQTETPLVVSRLEEVIADLEDYEPGLLIQTDALSLRIGRTELATFRLIARGRRVERALADGDYPGLRRHDHYLVPFFDEGGEATYLGLETERGTAVAAFTTGEMAWRFVKDGGAGSRDAPLRFETADGERLFGEIAELADGVVVNALGPRPPTLLPLPLCRAIVATAGSPGVPLRRSRAELM